ncbi:hypothetical protein F5544_11115 [Nocardia arthritidis]|uniref:Core-binding (CB) domain-containing protein n=1 Tax=Nocardia arthritidis TaxID=228602 RepID=A0A6G9YAC8_9NOCA|nr:hypothetical protein F5544_11115 [Nocardia arthritidis]
MGGDLDGLSELADDFKGELRQQNKSTGTINTYCRGIGYFAEFLAATADEFTREYISAYITDTLTRVNRRTGKPITPEYAHPQYRSLQQFAKDLLAEDILLTDPFARLTPPISVIVKTVPLARNWAGCQRAGIQRAARHRADDGRRSPISAVARRRRDER